MLRHIFLGLSELKMLFAQKSCKRHLNWQNIESNNHKVKKKLNLMIKRNIIMHSQCEVYWRKLKYKKKKTKPKNRYISKFEFQKQELIISDDTASYCRGNRNRDVHLRRSRISDRIRDGRTVGSCGNHPWKLRIRIGTRSRSPPESNTCTACISFHNTSSSSALIEFCRRRFRDSREVEQLLREFVCWRETWERGYI